MRPFRGSLWCCALAALLAGGETVKAAWNNVFQVCCHNCRSATSNYIAAAPPAPACGCPQQACTTRYVQRCYYQPVTTYRQSCYMQPVTTYRTSYYYESVTSYRYSCYYDPCSCSYQQVAQPVTSYRLRSQCCPVTSYLQRCCLQPVTTYQQAFYYEPVTTCCTTSVGAPVATLPPGATSAPGAVAVPSVPSVPSGPSPGVSSQPTNPPPAVSSEEGSPPPGQIQSQKLNSGYGDRPPKMPVIPDNSSFRQPQLQAPVPAQPIAPAPDRRVRFDRITSAPRYNAAGQVLRADRGPQAGARIVFVSADNNGTRQAVTTDASGRFETTLATGTWRIYVSNSAGRLVYQQKVDVRAEESVTPLTLVSR